MAHEEHLRRKPDRALVAGVCVGLADYLGIEPLIARAVMLGVAAASGIGIVLYALAWALIPSAQHEPWSWRRAVMRWREAAAIALFTIAALFALRRLGLWLGDFVVWPSVLGMCGLALIVRQIATPDWPDPAEAVEAAAHAVPQPRLPWRRWPAGVFGAVLFMGAAVVVVHDAGVLPLSGRALAGTSLLLIAMVL